MTESILSNKAQCRKCGDIIESKHRHDFRSCKCGAISVDGGKAYLRRAAMDFNDLIELSEVEEDDDTNKKAPEGARSQTVQQWQD